MHRAQDVVPVRGDGLQVRIEIAGSIADEQLGGHRPGRRLAEEQHHVGALVGRQLDRRLQRAAGIEAGADSPGKSVFALQRRGVIDGAVTPQELGAVTRPGRLPAAEVGERHARAEVGAPRIACEHRAGVRVDLGHDERRAGAARLAERPLDIGGDRQAPPATRRVRQGQTRDLDRIVEGDELQQMQRHTVAHTLEPAVALSVSRHVGADLLTNRQGRRAPDLAGLVVPDVDRLVRRLTVTGRALERGRAVRRGSV